jgi:ABC-type glycerol-3-phosphate transport system substrate-binding protein
VVLQIWENVRFRFREDVGKEITDPLLAANPWLTLQTDAPPGNLREKFVAASAAGSPPDTYNANSAESQTDFVEGLTDSLEPYLKNSKTVKKADIWPSLRLDVEFRGNLTAMPYAPDTRILFTHQENALRAGLDPERPPARWSELEGAAQRAFRGSASGVEHLGWHPFMGSGANNLWLVPYWQLGGELLNPEQTRVTLANERAVRALTWLKRVVELQGGWGAIEAYRNKRPNPAGEAIFMEGGATYLHATLSERGEQFAVKAPAMRYSVASYPLPDEGGTVATYGGLHAFPIASGSQNSDATWLFIEHITSDENNLKLALRFDRVPIRESATASAAYAGTDKGRALQAKEMQRRRFVIAAPGRPELRPFEDVVTPYMTGKMPLQDLLRQQERQMQQVLDTWLDRARAAKLG